jgi:hypothetical protein
VRNTKPTSGKFNFRFFIQRSEVIEIVPCQIPNELESQFGARLEARIPQHIKASVKGIALHIHSVFDTSLPVIFACICAPVFEKEHGAHFQWLAV